MIYRNFSLADTFANYRSDFAKKIETLYLAVLIFEVKLCTKCVPRVIFHPGREWYSTRWVSNYIIPTNTAICQEFFHHVVFHQKSIDG